MVPVIQTGFEHSYAACTIQIKKNFVNLLRIFETKIMECKAIEVPAKEKPAGPMSQNNKRILEAVKSGKAMVIQHYNGKCLVRYEYSDEEGTIVVLAERLECVSGKTEKVDFSWHKVVTVYTLSQATLY